MQSTTTTTGKLRGDRKSTRGRRPVAAGQLARVREGESSAAAGQPVLVGEGEAVGDGALAEEGEEMVEGSSSVAGPQDVSFLKFGSRAF